jgi:1,2-phenylacetyl-CoA epoxidase catalytic subunit
MSKKELKQKFLNKMELFYRNFGNEWTIDDFAKNQSHKDYLQKFLQVLQEKGIVAINENGKSFTILDLPSNYENLVS